MLYYFLLIFNLLIDACHSTHVIVQYINWLTNFTKLIAFPMVKINITSRV